MNKGRVVILTALNLEYEAVRNELVDVEVHWHPAGTRFETGRIGEGGCEVALGLVGKGNHPAAVLAERAIAEFSPAALLFVGVAGALWPNIKLGDVVVASQVYAYHGGTSEDDGFKARPRTWEISHRAAQIVQHLIRTEGWHGCPESGDRPQAHFGPIAAGEVVQDSTLSEQSRWIRDHYNDALAIEMEGAGVAQAGHLNRSLPVVVIRGISDRADGSKSSTDGKSWQPRAAGHAAAFAAALAPQLSTDTGEDESRPMGATYHSIATGNARVGVMAGQVHGNITFGGDQDQPADPPAAIADLRGRIKEAHRDGHLDPATYAAAEAELDTASRSLGDKSKLLLALKRFRGLVSDIAEIAVVVGAIIAGLKELP
jgi:8-oxo-dGTP diphosphatase